MTMTAIAEIIGVSKSTVSREVKRNCDERGANENTNGLARQYIPKGSDFDLYSEENIAEIEWKLNHRPRKSLLPSVRHCDAVALGNENLTENS